MCYEVKDNWGTLAQFVFMQDAMQFMRSYPLKRVKLALWCLKSGKLLNPEDFGFNIRLSA